MATQVNPNPSPKARFQAVNGAITAHKAMLENPYFDRGCDFAMLEYQRICGENTKDANTAMAAGSKMLGALEFLQTLKTLAETQPTIVARKDLDNLPSVGDLRKQ
jgi:hypothetical protein